MNLSHTNTENIEARFKNHRLLNKQTEIVSSTNNVVTAVFSAVGPHRFLENVYC